jgi:carbamoyltransferase
MIILGLIDSKPSTAAIMINGRIGAAISEERLSRQKMANGTPRQAIRQVMTECGVAPADIDLVAVAQQASPFQPESTPWDGWFELESDRPQASLTRLSSSLAPLLGNTPPVWHAHHALKRLWFRERRSKLPALLRNDYGIQAPVRFYDHHFCHATTAYYTGGLLRALVVTLDGGGDGRSGSVYVGDNGRLRPLASVDSYNSLGNFYAYITALCGFKAELHEGKVTGLAALGQPLYADILRRFVRYQEPGQIRYSIPMYHRSALDRLRAALPPGFDRAALAASAQQILEEIGTTFVRHWLRRTGITTLAVAGGVFANVKLNQRLHALSDVEAFFVHPAMDDSGLALGAALAACAEQPGVDPASLLERLPDVYLGPQYTQRQMEAAVEAADLAARSEPAIHATVARLLAEGAVVARFTGRMEYGPRALGHRSILYQTTDASVNEWLNDQLNRTEFMPFAPATLAPHATECFSDIGGAEDPARFMTITFDCSAQMRATSPGVVHVDGTARPQIIDADTAPDLHAILTAYHQLTGIPSLINTSFNMHGEPIVCSPQDAVRSFQQGGLDYLAMGNLLVANPQAARLHERRRAATRMAANALED